MKALKCRPSERSEESLLQSLQIFLVRDDTWEFL
jgi:hypothetical protein